MIQDNLWTAYSAVVVFGALCLFAVFLVIRFVVIVFRSFKDVLNEEFEPGHDPDEMH
jgi:hypothetical protein